jgi:hypothetical protein
VQPNSYWEYLLQRGLDLEHLESLINITFEGDSGRASPELKQSRKNGPHAKLVKLKKSITNDESVYRQMAVYLRQRFIMKEKTMKKCFPTENASIVAFRQGREFIEQRDVAIAKSKLDQHAWKSLARGRPSRQLMERMAREMSVDFVTLKSAVEFAEAVDTITSNCGDKAFNVLFDEDCPQPRKAIMQLSRTADTRQRYRIDGVSAGRFRSIGPQNKDFVFDTVAFSEVPSRLARARGALAEMPELLERCDDAEITAESSRLATLCARAAKTLRRFLKADSKTEPTIPRYLAKDTVIPVLESREVTGKTVGKGRQALRLTIKNVWDFSEMCRRNLVPTERERSKCMDEIVTIISTAKSIRQGANR